MIIGITGPSGSGKTTFLELIREFGGMVLDCDAIYHDLLRTDKNLLCAIDSRFPGCVAQGILDRKKLGAIVFADPAALEDLNTITQTAVKEKVLEQLACSPSLAAIDAIGLFESGLDKLCHVTVAVTAPDDVRIARLMVRDGISREYAQKRIAAQKPDSWFRQMCGYCLENNGTARQFRDKCLAFLGELGIMKEKQ